MVDDVVSYPKQQVHSILHRRSFSSAAHHISGDLELLSIRPASREIYTSLRDLLPTVPVNSPSPQPGYDICIRNRLVKQAAWAYLQPMSTSTGSAGDSFFHRMWPRLAAVMDLVRRGVASAVETLRVLCIRSPVFPRVV